MRSTTPEGAQEYWLSAEGGGGTRTLRYRGPEGAERVALLRFREDRDEMPLEWRSRLGILKPAPGGGAPLSVTSDEVRVNDYFVFDGFRFFQTNARSEEPDYSGIGVVYDPGIEPVLFGLYLATLGTVIAFLLKPLLTRRTPAL